MRKNWYLGFLGLFFILGLPGIITQDWRDMLWLVWLVWFIYFVPEKHLATAKKYFSLAALVIILVVVIMAIINWQADLKNNQPPLVGNDRDAHGCIGSAGYSWCEARQKCLRPWEEACSKETNERCEITNCHGLDIQCGANPPEACTMLYALGDRCRQYATCGLVNGTCQPTENTKFTQCRKCVTDCLGQYPNDPEKQFACEGQCQ